MTSRERIAAQLARKKVDRIGVSEGFWKETTDKWRSEGKLDSSPAIHFDFDIAACGAIEFVADIKFKRVILEEDEDTYLEEDGNGAKLRWHKKHASTPEHVGFLVNNRADWEKYTKPLLKSVEERIDFIEYRNSKKNAEAMDKFFCLNFAHAFELMKNVTGHVNMLMGMALDPDWIKDMVMTYSQMMVDLMDMLFEREGYPDGLFIYEDMGFKHKPFMSPAMYDDIIKAGHKLTIDYAHSKGLPVIMHSCGYIEPLLLGMIEAGIDCLQAMEVKAGMDVVKLYKQFGDQISFMGGFDVRILEKNDKELIDKELNRIIPVVGQNYGYILHSDHSIPNSVEYDTYKYFVERGIELGTY